jgi:hypothetical protein
MLLRNRLFRPDPLSPDARPGYGLLTPEAIKVLARLSEQRVDFILIGAVAQTITAGSTPSGPVAIVPSPYRRNLERLASARALLAMEGLSLEVRSESSSRYQEMLYEARAHEVAAGVRVEVASPEHLRVAQPDPEPSGGEIRVARVAGTPAASSS